LIKRYEWAFYNRLIRDISANVKLVMTVFNQKHLAGAINKE
jgi:predicted N-acyltransferase